jgi:hypothetical protein
MLEHVSRVVVSDPGTRPSTDRRDSIQPGFS